MVDGWKTVTASEVTPGDHVIAAGTELTVSRIEAPFLGRENMIAFIEDTPDRWLKRPVPSDAEVEVQIVT